MGRHWPPATLGDVSACENFERKLANFGCRYPLGIVYGFVMGGLSSFCRSLFGELIPPGFEAAFYALYAITDKGSSIFGPAIVGAITDAYGEIRPVSIPF
jgi:MFS-type transporter involved in bile tolerance (Atg22 family)